MTRAAPPAPASQEGDGQPEGWQERLADLAGLLWPTAGATTPSSLASAVNWIYGRPERTASHRAEALAADLRAALAAASQDGGGLAAPLNWSHSLNDGSMVVDPPPAETGGGGLPEGRRAADLVEEYARDKPELQAAIATAQARLDAERAAVVAQGAGLPGAVRERALDAVVDNHFRLMHDAGLCCDPREISERTRRVVRSQKQDDAAVAAEVAYEAGCATVAQPPAAGPGGGLDREAVVLRLPIDTTEAAGAALRAVGHSSMCDTLAGEPCDCPYPALAARAADAAITELVASRTGGERDGD